MKDSFIACVDGLSGLPEAIETAYPQTRVQLCMVHLMRNSARLRVAQAHAQQSPPTGIPIYSASTESEAEFNLELKAREMGCTLSQHKPRPGEPDFPRVIPLFAFSEDIRKVIYTTTAMESLTMTLRKVTRNHRIFPSEEVVYLAMRTIAVARGRCRSMMGSLRSIASPLRVRDGFLND